MRILLACLLALMLVPELRAQSLGRTYDDKEYGYSVKTISRWKQIPPEPTDQHTKARWVAPRPERGFAATWFSQEILVFDRPSSEKKPQEVAGLRIPGYERDTVPWGEGAFAKRFLQRRYRGMKDLGEAERIRIRCKQKDLEPWAAVYEVRTESGFRGDDSYGKTWVLIVTTKTREWVMMLSCAGPSEKKYQRLFQGVIRSFTVLSAPEAVGEGDEPEDPKSAREEARERARRDARRTAGWWYEETPNYFIVTDVDRKKLGLIKEIGRRLEFIRKVYERDFPPTKEITAVSIVRVCGNRETYLGYGAPPSSAGYWSSMAKELVIYAEGNTRETFSTLMHEAFHQYIFYACGEIAPHSWYNEGHGDYYAGADLRAGKIKPFLWRRDTIKTAIREGNYVPWKEMIRYSQRQYYARSSLCYAQGWSMVYFLREGVDEDHPWARILPTYLQTMQKAYDAAVAENPDGRLWGVMDRIREQAVKEAFEGVDLEEIEEAWKKFTAGV